jgi:hypothetical protein
MAAAAQFRTQHVASVPSGWQVRSKAAGEHTIVLAFPPGRRRKGSGRLIEILHPPGNPACQEGSCNPSTKKNIEELLIFGNPSRSGGTRPSKRRRKNAAMAGHKPGCKCFACKHARGESPSFKSQRRSRVGARHAVPLHRNPTETQQAVKLYESFHGKDPKGIIDAHISAAVRKEYAVLGDLVAIGLDDCRLSGAGLTNKWETCPHLKFEGTKLASSPNGKQLYVIGVTNLDGSLRQFKVDASKDFIDLGSAAFVVYLARKVHGNFEPIDYVHKFGEKGGDQPTLFYDKLRKQLAFVGGSYFIDTKDGVSPGIEN